MPALESFQKAQCGLRLKIIVLPWSIYSFVSNSLFNIPNVVFLFILRVYLNSILNYKKNTVQKIIRSGLYINKKLILDLIFTV